MKEKRGKKSQRRVEKRKRKEKKSEDYCVTLKTKNYLKLFLSAHAQTSKVNISHLDQKAIVVYLFIYLFAIYFFQSGKNQDTYASKTKGKQQVHVCL